MNLIDTRGPFERDHFRRVMGSFATGVTVILANAEGDVRGMTANAFMSGSLEPPLCVISVAKRSHMHAHLKAAQYFSVNILAAGQEDQATHFAGRPVAHFVPKFDWRGGVPILARTAATITAAVAAGHDCGDHTIFVGEIANMQTSDRPPLLYHASHFASLVPLREDAPYVPEFW